MEEESFQTGPSLFLREPSGGEDDIDSESEDNHDGSIEDERLDEDVDGESEHGSGTGSENDEEQVVEQREQTVTRSGRTIRPTRRFCCL